VSNPDFVAVYVQSCASGKLALSECEPAWQLLVIIVLLLLASSTLAALRLRSRSRPGNG